MKRQWTGGAYEEREGIVAEAAPDGITISGWYDGGCGLEVVGHLTWAELDAMREASRD